MSALPDPPEPVLETAARELTEATAPHPRIYEVPPEQGRQILADLQSGDGVPKPLVEEQWVSVDAGPRGTVRTRIVRPVEASGDLPVLIYIHGAGWVFGDENTHDRLVRELAVGAGVAVVFPVYDRAPEAKYPAQIEQNYAVARWVGKQGREYGLDTSRIAVCGDSVGGNMATVLALMAVERGDLDLRAQVLLYPVTDANFETASYRQFADGYYLTRDGMQWFWDQYLPDPAQRGDVYASPLQAAEDRLAALPTTLVHHRRGRRAARRRRGLRGETAGRRRRRHRRPGRRDGARLPDARRPAGLPGDGGGAHPRDRGGAARARRVVRGQFRSTSMGWVASSASGIGCRRST